MRTLDLWYGVIIFPTPHMLQYHRECRPHAVRPPLRYKSAVLPLLSGNCDPTMSLTL